MAQNNYQKSSITNQDYVLDKQGTHINTIFELNIRLGRDFSPAKLSFLVPKPQSSVNSPPELELV